jgi:hypothetical protein
MTTRKLQKFRAASLTNDRSPADVAAHLQMFAAIEEGLAQGFTLAELVAAGVAEQGAADVFANMIEAEIERKKSH